MCPARVVEGVPAPMLAAVSGLAGARLAVIPHPGTARLRGPTADLGPAATTVASPEDALRITENDHRFLPSRPRFWEASSAARSAADTGGISGIWSHPPERAAQP